MYLGGASLAWCSDYSQIYFVDVASPAIAGIEDVGEEAFTRGYFTAVGALVVYTVDCLRQEVRIALHDGPPPVEAKDMMSEDVWTKVIETRVVLPSRKFTISSPSKAGGETWGPVFTAPHETLNARIQWLEYENEPYDAYRPKPDVIAVTLWPAS